MKTMVPPAPLAPHSKPKVQSRAPYGLVEAFDAGFISRILASMLAVGAVFMLAILGATKSPIQASSFFCGVALGALLLKSQELFVRRVLGPRAEGEKSLWARAPLAVVLPLKYIFVGAVLGIATEAKLILPTELAVGFIVGQVVIVAKVIGRFAALKMRAGRN